MAQEIITYVIIVVAAGLAFYKSYYNLKRKKLLKSTLKNTESSASKSACPECAAECILRDTPKKFKNENAQFCERKLEDIKCS